MKVLQGLRVWRPGRPTQLCEGAALKKFGVLGFRGYGDFGHLGFWGFRVFLFLTVRRFRLFGGLWFGV